MGSPQRASRLEHRLPQGTRSTTCSNEEKTPRPEAALLQERQEVGTVFGAASIAWREQRAE